MQDDLAREKKEAERKQNEFNEKKRVLENREKELNEYRDELTKKEEKFSLEHDTYDKAVNDYERLNCKKIEVEKQVKEGKQKLGEREE